MDKRNGLFEVRNITVGSSYQYSKGLSGWVFSDFTKDFIGVPWDEIDAVAKAYGANFDSTTEQYIVPCKVDLPSLMLMVGGDTLVIPGSSLRSPLEDTEELCLLNIDDSDNWVFGSPLARSYCQIIDVGGQQIGFAAPK
ncbi:aspartic protease 2B [Aphelenchoides avenae]|nr:aspartic protease 2B [Aphelenchus avenae]